LAEQVTLQVFPHLKEIMVGMVITLQVEVMPGVAVAHRLLDKPRHQMRVVTVVMELHRPFLALL
jgi:hypothetical protein